MIPTLENLTVQLSFAHMRKSEPGREKPLTLGPDCGMTLSTHHAISDDFLAKMHVDPVWGVI